MVDQQKQLRFRLSTMLIATAALAGLCALLRLTNVGWLAVFVFVLLIFGPVLAAQLLGLAMADSWAGGHGSASEPGDSANASATSSESRDCS